MQVLQALKHLSNYSGCLCLRHAVPSELLLVLIVGLHDTLARRPLIQPAPPQVARQCDASDVLYHQVKLLLRLYHIVKFRKVPVLELVEDGDLFEDCVFLALERGLLIGFDRDDHACGAVDCRAHGGVRARTEDFAGVVVRNLSEIEVRKFSLLLLILLRFLSR